MEDSTSSCICIVRLRKASGVLSGPAIAVIQRRYLLADVVSPLCLPGLCTWVSHALKPGDRRRDQCIDDPALI